MIIIRPEKLSSVKDQVCELLEEHYQELTLHKNIVALDVDWDRYFKLEKAGMLHVIVARDEGIPIGYAVFFTHMHMHYKRVYFASNDVLYLRKEYRNYSTIGLRLIKESEDYMRKLGVEKITWHIKDSNDWSAILLRKGYCLEETVYSKVFGGG